jgi:tetratricopeptide (TPR) repeat protein
MVSTKRGKARWTWIGIVVGLVFALMSTSAMAGNGRARSAGSQDIESQAQRLFDEGRYGEAATLMQSILRDNPQNRTANILLSFMLARQGQVGPAIAQTRRALDLFPSSVKLQLLLAGLLGLQDATRNESMQRFEAILRADPSNPMALLGLAENEHSRGNPYAAVERFTRLAERFPDDARYQVRIAQNYVSLGQLDLARDIYARAYTLAPTNVDAVRSLAILGDALDRPADAVRYYRELVTLFPSDVWARLALRTSEESLAEPPLPRPVEEMSATPLNTYMQGLSSHSQVLQMRREQIDATKLRSAVRFLPSFYVSPSTGRFGDTHTSNFNFSLGWNLPDLLYDSHSINLRGMKADLEGVQNNLLLDVSETYYQRLATIGSYRQAQQALALDPTNVQVRQNKRQLKLRLINLSQRLQLLSGLS